ncbi:glycoside hydrolase family 2 protein [Nevskia soli]|uniref:glycoside hydrolase family 2 protein n=1 Tax=Nevskia soli TaxID=418856 RepID=UPI000B0134FF|nr:glycoside hydrolase family 2 protein [Nevskia soli]
MAIPQSPSATQGAINLESWEMAILPPGTALDPSGLATIPVEWLPAEVPGTAFSALFAAGRADFCRLPNLDAQDVWYRCRFDYQPREVGTRHALVFEGLATLAEVWLNDVRILESCNMFLAHEVEANPNLRAVNDLLIRFASLNEALGVRQPRPRWRTQLVGQQQLRWIRTSLLGHMPGWAPATPAIGPWRPVSLQPRRHFEWAGGALRANLEGNTGVLRVDARLRTWSDDACIAGARLHLGEHAVDLRVRRGECDIWQIEGDMRLDGVRPWWPHTHGEPTLYPVAITVDTGAGSEVLDFGKTGFRRLELRCEGDDFALKVNGVDLFCRGACWTGTDVLTLTAGEAITRETLLLAKEAGMNMLRISGTMFYEAGHFYALCDELGILVWQDWMFASMDYPSHSEAFLSGVESEASQFLHRTQLSPCIAMLCGSSEVEQQAAMLGLDRSLWRNQLFGEILPRLGATIRPDVPYWPSSPAGGTLPFQVDSGVAHYFGVGAYLQPLTDARRCGVRFASECLAFANVPESQTIDQVVGDGESPVHHPAWKARVPRDTGAGWDFEDVRDHYLTELFEVDPTRLRRADMARYLALSRVASGEVMAATFGEWRRVGSLCAGGLVWFFRDFVPGPGWGLVDSTGLPKAPWYYLKRALAPVALFIINEGVNGLALHAVNDRAYPLAARLTLTLFRHGKQQVAEGTQDIVIPARGGVQLRDSVVLGRFLDSGYTFRFGPPGHDLVHAVLREANTGEVLGSDFYFPMGHAFGVQPDIGLEAEALAEADGSYQVTIRSRHFAQAVCIDAPGFRPSHNYFHLAPGGAQQLKLLQHRPGARLQASISALNCAKHMTLLSRVVELQA